MLDFCPAAPRPISAPYKAQPEAREPSEPCPSPAPAAREPPSLARGEGHNTPTTAPPTPVISRLYPSAIPLLLALPRPHATLRSFRRMEGS